MRPAIGTPEWQHARAHELLWHRSDDLEAMVRRLADEAIQDPRTYRVGTVFPYLPSPPNFVPDQEPSEVVVYHNLTVRLVGYLRNKPHAARLIAEEMLRDQIARLT